MPEHSGRTPEARPFVPGFDRVFVIESRPITINGKTCRELLKCGLWEASFVPVAMNPTTNMITIKGTDLVAVEGVKRLLPGFPSHERRDRKLEQIREKAARDRARFLLAECEIEWAGRRPAELAAKAVSLSIMNRNRLGKGTPGHVSRLGKTISTDGGEQWVF